MCFVFAGLRTYEKHVSHLECIVEYKTPSHKTTVMFWTFTMCFTGTIGWHDIFYWWQLPPYRTGLRKLWYKATNYNCNLSQFITFHKSHTGCSTKVMWLQGLLVVISFWCFSFHFSNDSGSNDQPIFKTS